MCVFGGAEILPKDGVINVASTIEFDLCLKGHLRGQVGAGLRVLKLVECDIEIGDVGGVVLLMVQLHDFCRNHGLEGVVVVGQVGKSVFSSTLAAGQQTESSSNHEIALIPVRLTVPLKRVGGGV